MKYPRILAALRSARWCVTPATLHAIYDTLGAHLRGHPLAVRASLTPDQVPLPAAPGPASHAPTPTASHVAIIEVHGIIGKNLSAMDVDCGGCDLNGIAAALDAAVADPACSAIVLDFDSPGGVVTGVPEMTERIRQLDALKPIYAYVGAQCCSAAYWLASACRVIVCTKSADLGSIGVYVALCDDSEWWKKEGYKLELIKAGEFKAMGISGQPLAEKERALIQADVDSIYAMFTTDVRAGRGEIADATCQGQTFMGAAALAANLADEMVNDLADLVAELSQPAVASA